MAISLVLLPFSAAVAAGLPEHILARFQRGCTAAAVVSTHIVKAPRCSIQLLVNKFSDLHIDGIAVTF